MSDAGAPGCSGDGGPELSKFHILDETDESDESGRSDGSVSDDIPQEELDRLIEDAVAASGKRKQEEDGDESCKSKVVLIERGEGRGELPEGWQRVVHSSGMPVYLHKTARVCTLSKPYFLGPGSARKHSIPVDSIPCLNYKNAKEWREAQPPNGQIVDKKHEDLNPEQMREYCQNLFQFKTMSVLRFKSWSERRKYAKKKKREKQMQRPTLPDGSKLITVPIYNTENPDDPRQRKEWVMNPNGKSYVCILHEYVQHALMKQPSYEFSELENAATPYAATVIIQDMRYGSGYGSSKKQAKAEAAKRTLEIFIPGIKAKIAAENDKGAPSSEAKDQDLSFFDEIRVEDPRVAEFCTKTTEPPPFNILQTCLQRNFGSDDDVKIHYQGSSGCKGDHLNRFTMTIGKHTVTVSCRDKREGKQRASQMILQKLHPNITSWGSLLRLYGNRSVKSFKEKKMDEQEIGTSQCKGSTGRPNYAILEKLSLEFGKVRRRKPSTGEGARVVSNVNLKNVDL